MNRTVLIIAIIIVLIGGFALVQSQKNSQSTQNTTANTTTTTAPSSPAVSQTEPASSGAMKAEPSGAMSATVKEFTVTGKNFSFTPSTMTVNKGDTVKITFKNDSGFHDLKIDEFNVATKQIPGGQTETVEFIADKAGTFEYYCSVGNHRAMGMKGTLTVK